MIKACLTGHHDNNGTGAVCTVTLDGGDVKLKASIADASFLGGSSFNDLTLSLEKPSSFAIDYSFPKRDVRFQFMDTARVMGRPLSMTYTHWKGENMTSVDGTLMIDAANKLSAYYGFGSGNCKLKYSCTHEGFTTLEPSYDFSKNSWDLAVSRKIYENDVLRASYQSSTKLLGLEWRRKSGLNKSIKMSASVNLADKSKIPMISADTTFNFDV